jgi:acyl-CoA thioesterase FadM
MRYRQPARYDDLVRIRCWVRELASRRVTFGYAIEMASDGRLLATGSTAMLVLDASMTPSRLPDDIRAVLEVVPDPVRL